MESGGKPFVQSLVTEQIRRLVAEAIESGETISTADVIEKVRGLYPKARISKRVLANEIMMAAAAAGIPVEIGGRRPARKSALGEPG